jgi:uncharacterized protein (TIGR03546 family)
MFIVWIAKVLAALNANTRPGEIGAAVAYAFLLALIPGGNLLWFALLLASFFVRINNAMLFVFLAVFSLVAVLFDPLTDLVGYAVLKAGFLAPFWTTLANTPFVPWTKFNNTLVAGGLVVGLVVFVPLAWGFAALVKAWRTGVREKLYGLKSVQAFLKWPLVSTVSKILGKIFSVAKGLA